MFKRKTALSFRVRLASLVGFALVAATAQADCDANVSQMTTKHLAGHSLCELQSRYRAAVESLKRQGVADPERIGNVLAPRFINMSDWTKYLAKNGDSPYAAWLTYDPKPLTWGKWSESAAVLEDPAVRAVFMNGSTDDMIKELLALHAEAMTGLLPPDRCGVFRDKVNRIEEIIPLHKLWNAYKVSDVAAIQSAPYYSYQTHTPLVRFIPRFCDNVLAVPSSPVPPSKEFRLTPGNAAEPLKICGNLYMAPPAEVGEQMRAWVSYLGQGLKSLSANPRAVDPLEIAATVQQWYVYVHPFIDGNGRTSRFMMELVFYEAHLPLPTLDDMDQDFFSTPSQWADRVGKGMLNTVLAIENCARNPHALGCAVVSKVPPRI